MTMVKTLVALATERMLLKTSGPTFLRGIEFMYAAGLAPDRLSVMMTSSHKYVLQFHSKCDIRPFAANYPNFGRVLRGIVHVREWRIKSIEFVNVAFYMRDVDNLERAIEKLGVELVLLRNCTYPGVNRGDEAVKFLSALNRKKQAVVCEYGDDRLKHRIGRRSSGNRARRASRNGGGQEVVAPPAAAAAAPQADNIMAGMQEAVLEIAPPAPPADPPAVAAAPEHFAPAGLPPLRRPIPLNMEEARRILPQMIPGNNQPVQGAFPPLPAQEAQQAVPARNGMGRIAVGAHVYEFRAVDVPNVEQIPAVNNLPNLLHMLSDNSNELRVIVLPPGESAPSNLNNNPGVLYRHHSAPQQPPQDPAPRASRNAQDHYQPPHQYQQQQMYRVHNFAPVPPTAHHNNLPYVAAAGPQIVPHALMVPVPMFGVAVNEAQVQRGGDDSNDSTDREDPMYDPEQQRNDALRDLVADPEAQPNFAPVEAQGVDLEMLEEGDEEEEEEDEEDDSEDVMDEGDANEPNFIIADQPLLE